MKKHIALMAVLSLLAFLGTACATKKYARTRVNERVAPLENRVGELEETSRRNTQDIGRISQDITDVRGRADRAQSQADAAIARAEEANNRAGTAEQSVNDIRANLDRYALQSTAKVNFKSDSYELAPEAQSSLDQLASQIKDRSNFILEIEGFADAKGTDVHNNHLAAKRADAVRRYLAERHSIPLFRMHVIGMGKVRPVADNTTPEGRAQNRRVEIRLLTRNAGATSVSKAQSSS
jgi:outer membrane protein OmpA-like peptidoglycan-associated protein